MPPGGRRFAAVVLIAASVGPVAAGAPAGGDDLGRLQALKRQEAGLAARERSALLSLYALDTRVQRARAELASVRSRLAAVTRERDRVRVRLEIARRTLELSESVLADRIRALYEHGEADPLAVLLGATSIDDAVSELDGLEVAAQQDREIIERTRAQKGRLRDLGARLDAHAAEVVRLAAAVESRAADLERSRAARASALARIVSKRSLTQQRMAAIERQLSVAEARTTTIVADAGSPPPRGGAADGASVSETAAPPAARRGATLRVVATAYAIHGRTAIGLKTGWGVAAVDPAVIPLGTWMTVPGYGTAIAVDVGPAVRGAEIDLWFPTRAAALAWGRRAVTIELH